MKQQVVETDVNFQSNHEGDKIIDRQSDRPFTNRETKCLGPEQRHYRLVAFMARTFYLTSNLKNFKRKMEKANIYHLTSAYVCGWLEGLFLSLTAVIIAAVLI